MNNSKSKSQVVKRMACLAGIPVLVALIVGADRVGYESQVQFKLPNIPKIPGKGSDNRSDTIRKGAELTVQTVEGKKIGREDEEKMGTAVALVLTNSPYRVYTDEKLTDYVTKVGLTIAAVSKSPDYDYVFGVLDRDDLAAYSAPGGFVFISRGAIAAMEDESELAGVLAHEIGHVAEQHGMDAVNQKKFMTGLVNVGMSAAQQDQLLADMVDEVVDETINKKFSQGQETAADREAVKYVIAAGYDPNGYVRFLQRMAQKQGGREKVFGTHPGLDRRVRDVRKEIGQKTGGATLKERFMRETAGVRGK
jgi:predicted Zn-dependent protease